MATPYLSIIIPAYNEEHRLPFTLQQVKDFIASQPYQTEVIVVENGSSDGTYAIAQKYAMENDSFRVMHVEPPGKGMAVRRGMLEAQGEYRFMCDADLSMPVDQINRFLPPQLQGCDIAIGSREAPGAVRYNEPLYRHWGGRLLNFLVRLLALPGMHDTQCGFKCFSAKAAQALYPLQTLAGWSFDIEILFLARKKGFKIIEVPIPWYYNPESKLNPVKDAINTVLDILKIRKNALTGVYDPGSRPAGGVDLGG